MILRNRLLVTIAAFLIFVIAACELPPDYYDPPSYPDIPPPDIDLNVVSYSIWEETDGNGTIFGEIENLGSDGAYGVQVAAILYDSGGSKIGTRIGDSIPSTIPPSKIYPFQIETGIQKSLIATVDLEISYISSSTDDPESGLSVQNVAESTWIGDLLELTGEVRNTSPETKDFCRAVAVFYDSSDNVVYADLDYTDPSTIFSGEFCTFDMWTSIEAAQFSSYSTFAVSSTNF